MIAAWTPPEWVYNRFPMSSLETEAVTLDYVIAAMQVETDSCTEWDSTPLGRVLHVAHMLVSHQGDDGLWASVFNLCTGEEIGVERSSAPLPLLHRLNSILDSSEFDFALRRGEAGVLSHKG
jgi:hypothetical protein